MAYTTYHDSKHVFQVILNIPKSLKVIVWTLMFDHIFQLKPLSLTLTFGFALCTLPHDGKLLCQDILESSK